MIKPVFEELSDETEDVKFYKVDVDAQTDIAQECGIQAVSSLSTLHPPRNHQKSLIVLHRCPPSCFLRMGRNTQSSEVQ